MTLGGLALGTGMLVDNAIVVIESIFRRISEGENTIDAIALGTSTVGGAIVTSTLTTCIVFLPIIFVDGMAAKLISGISFTVVVSLVASLFVAVFLIPALSVLLLSKGHVQDIDPGSERVENLVTWLLERPFKVIFMTALFVILTVSLLSRLGTELLPPSDPKQFSLRVITQQVNRSKRLKEQYLILNPF